MNKDTILSLQFEGYKYKNIIAQSQSLTELDKDLLSRLVDEYYKAKSALRFSENWQYVFTLTEEQEAQMAAIALSPKYSFEVKQIAQNMLKQTFIFQNCAQNDI